MRTNAYIPEGWHVATLSELSGCITSGATPEAGNPRYYTPTAGHPFAKIEDLTKTVGHELHDCGLEITDAALRETAAKLYPVGTILVSMYGTIGLVKMCGRPLSANQALCALLPPFDCDPGFLLHHLDFIRSEWTKYSGQTTQPNINGSIVRAHQVLLPPMEEQGVISGVLDTLDTTIRQTEAIIEKLKQVKQGLLHDLLTRGIDANGELRPPQSEAPHLYKASPLGWIPHDWDCSTTDEIADAPICYGIVQVLAHVPNGVAVLAIKDLLGDYLFGVHRTARSIDAAYARSRVAPGDVLVSIKGTIGRIGVVPSHYVGNISRDIARIRPNRKVVRAEFLAQLLRSPKGQQTLGLAQVGTTRAELSIAPLRRLLHALPPIDEQVLIEEQMAKMESQIEAERKALNKLKELKSGLMDDLLTGRVRVTPLLAQPATT